MEPFTAFTDLTGEMAITPDGTLSRVLFRDERIRVVGFAFDVGQELTEHTAAAAAVIQVISGRLQLTLGAESIDLGPTGWVHMAPGLPHSVVATEPTVMLLTMFPAHTETSTLT